MNRTAARPLAAQRIERPERILWLGVSMILLATLLAALFNPPLAFWIFIGAFIYIAVYTIWLKPRTITNIVIGGAAGSCAVISGGAAVGAWHNPAVWILAGLIFVWTPCHFWSLALAYREDYARADYPMLPALVSPVSAARWTALHTVATAIAGLALGLWPQVNLFYLIPVALATIGLSRYTITLLRTPQRDSALTLFHFTNLYLALVVLVIMISSVWHFMT